VFFNNYQTAIRSPAPLAQSVNFNGYTLKELGGVSAFRILSAFCDLE
jgi:hypothetical protein